MICPTLIVNLELITYAYLLLSIALMAGHILLIMPPMAGLRHDHIIINFVHKIRAALTQSNKTLQNPFFTIYVTFNLLVPSLYPPQFRSCCQLNNSKSSIFKMLTVCFYKSFYCWQSCMAKPDVDFFLSNP